MDKEDLIEQIQNVIDNLERVSYQVYVLTQDEIQAELNGLTEMLAEISKQEWGDY